MAPAPVASRSPAGRAVFETLAAATLLLPALLLAAPGGPTHVGLDLVPELSGTGVAALALLPAAAFLILRRRAPSVRGLPLLLGFGAVAAVSAWVVPPTDTLEATRFALTLATGLVAFLAGAALDRGGRAVLGAGLIALSLVHVVVAFSQEHGLLTGALGNTGAVAEAVLPGALVGAWFFAARRDPLAWLGLPAPLAWAALAGAAPVWTSVVAFLAALALAFVLPRRTPRGEGAAVSAPVHRGRLVLLGVLCLMAGGYGRLALLPPPPWFEPGDATPVGATTGGGLEVRARIAARIPALVADHALLGVGPGQFAAAFPPYRDPAEIEISSHGRTLPNETEVEHAHDDWLQGLAETGVVGGTLWIALLAWAGLRACRILVRGDERDHHPGLALAALGILVAAFGRAPFLANPGASAVAFTLLGCALARDLPRPRTPAGLALPVVLVLPLVVLAPRALDLVRHGAALRGFAWPIIWQQTPPRNGVLAALDACPDSVLARTLRARILGYGRQAPNDPPFSTNEFDAWDSVLEVRPHRVEAWMQLGVLHARAGRLAEARFASDRALALDPGHPALRRNRARVALFEGETADGLARVDSLIAESRFERGRLEAWAIELLQELDIGAARELLGRVDRNWRDLTGDEAWNVAEQQESFDHDRLARALRGLAHLDWARAQGAAGEGKLAVRSYRQARNHLARETDGVVEVAPQLRAELAAALLLAGRPDEAAAELEDLELSPLVRGRLPLWAVEILAGAR